MTNSPPVSSPDGVVAAFDFDKTLTRRDCVIPFIRRVTSARQVLATVFDVPHVLGAGVRRDRDRLKEILTKRAFSGMPRAALEESGRRFAEQVVEEWMRSDTLSRLDWHKKSGHLTGIVSASYGVYLAPIAENLGLDFVIATDLEFDHHGLATGRMVGGNCRGAEKARRLKVWLMNQGLNEPVLYAYGDSSGDRELLAMADYPHLIGKEAL